MSASCFITSIFKLQEFRKITVCQWLLFSVNYFLPCQTVNSANYATNPTSLHYFWGNLRKCMKPGKNQPNYTFTTAKVNYVLHYLELFTGHDTNKNTFFSNGKIFLTFYWNMITCAVLDVYVLVAFLMHFTST